MIGEQNMHAEAERDALVELMVRYQGGSSDAFNELYHRLSPVVRRLVLWRVFDRSLADDLVQESFLQIHRARATYLPPRPVTPWALGVTRLVVLMSLRRSRRLPDHEELSGLDLPIPPDLADHFERDRVQDALATLATEKREVVVLRYLLELSYEEVAGVLGITSGAARVRAHRAMSDLRKHLARESEPKVGRVAVPGVASSTEAEP